MSVRKFPPRFAYGEAETLMIEEVLQYYRTRGEDPGYQGVFEKQFCEAFSEFMGGGFSDAVSTGTASIYTALAALELPKQSEILISPVTDSGPLNCIIMQGYTPVLMDSRKGSYNIGFEQFIERITEKTSCVIIIHSGGEPVDEIEEICLESKRLGIRVLEDCSQSTGATVHGNKVGSFGDIAAFSTMYRKNLIAGSSGGLVYTKDENLYRLAMAHADRGKQVWRNDINQNDPGNALFPALNFNTDEISCGIGIASLSQLPKTIRRRLDFLEVFINQLRHQSKYCRPTHFNRNFSPFYFPIFVDAHNLSCSKKEFADALNTEGVPLNPHYGCIISSWSWAKKYIKGNFSTPNAEHVRDTSFNLFLNENYSERHAKEIIDAIVKLESYYGCF
jgi:dTDP-4-amino-4,6-dideoxygalactose transaminase